MSFMIQIKRIVKEILQNQAIIKLKIMKYIKL